MTSQEKLKTTHYPLQDEVGSIQYIQHCGSDKMVVNAARVSYNNDDTFSQELMEKDEKLLTYLMKHRHTTPFEHTLITYRIKAPLFVVQQLLRHRIGVSPNQESHRYVEASKGTPSPEFYAPRHFRYQDSKNKQSSSGLLFPEEYRDCFPKYLESCNQSFDHYKSLLDKGVCREQARGVLPMSTYSSLYYTLNLCSLIHFLSLRDASDTQWETRQYAKAMKYIASIIFPFTISLFERTRNDESST